MGNDIVKRVQWALLGQTSCCFCQYLYTKDEGYSNYTVEDTAVHCALDMNPNLLNEDTQVPWDWNYRTVAGVAPTDTPDNWSKTRDSRCEHYKEITIERVQLDVDGENNAFDFGVDNDVARTINEHSGRSKSI